MMFKGHKAVIISKILADLCRPKLCKRRRTSKRKRYPV